MDGNIHIFAQECYHEEAYIMADIPGLLSLRDAINELLEDKDVMRVPAFVETDGEGYDIVICDCTRDELRALESHYTNTDICPLRNKMLPSSLAKIKEGRVGEYEGG